MKKENVISSVYIHIPFCEDICSYCDFCKFYYNKELVDKYLDALYNEIKTNYKDDIIKTIYIGGGTPSSLSIEQIDKLLSITNIFNKDIIEFTFECNIENIDEDKIKCELEKILPNYMVPKSIVILDKIPVNNNGKYDRKKLESI